MLQHYRDIYATTDERINHLFESWEAKDTLTGIELCGTHGRSRGAHQYYVFAPEWAISHYLPYREWRVSIKAWSGPEAVQIANSDKRVDRMAGKVYESEFRRCIGDG